MTTTKILALILLNCFIQILPVCSDSQHLLEAWKKINTNYANDIQQSNNIYNKIKEEQNALEQLRIIVERHLRTKNAELLVNAISVNDDSIADKKLREIIKNISTNYDSQMIDGIFAQATDEIVLTRKLSQMPDLIWRIYHDNNLKYFEMMLRLQIQLYSSSSSRHHSDKNEFLQKFAYRLYKIKNESLYSSVDLNLKSNVQSIVDNLPKHLKYLYFMPYFCLLNIKYETYIYAAIEAKVDPLSRYIWLWYDNKSMDDTGYIKAEVSEYNMNKETKLKVLLKSTKYQLYYYMMASTNMIAGWDNAGTPSNHIWDLDILDNDRVVFSQNDYLMCAVELHDNERRNVGGRKKGMVSSSSTECQWRIGPCIFK
ncbi:uncharacterized protein LOC135952608 [Calliphora vicina]|uniref:uncharacterized protein LOC135952608 n=1 Tax=Calliphora vicina TaxID=7373 RepID=UPI00325B047C